MFSYLYVCEIVPGVTKILEHLGISCIDEHVPQQVELSCHCGNKQVAMCFPAEP